MTMTNIIEFGIIFWITLTESNFINTALNTCVKDFPVVPMIISGPNEMMKGNRKNK